MRIIPIAVAVCVVSGALAAQAPAPAVSNPDDRAVREVVRRYVEAREARDAKAVAALFTAEADQLVSSGEWRQGREQVVTGSLASSAQNSGKRTIDVERVRLVSQDVAIADGRYAITGGEARRSAHVVHIRDGQRSRRLADRRDPEHAAGSSGGGKIVAGPPISARPIHVTRSARRPLSSSLFDTPFHPPCRTHSYPTTRCGSHRSSRRCGSPSTNRRRTPA